MISMDIRTASASVPFGCRRLAAIATAAALGLGAVPAVAQTASQSLATRAEEQAQIVYSPWTKFCGKDQKTPANEVCLTVKEGRNREWAARRWRHPDRAGRGAAEDPPHHAAFGY